MKKISFFALASMVWFASCKPEETTPMPTDKSFTVTVRNKTEAKDYFVSGTTGLIMPGESYSFSFHAGKDHYLQFGTMFVMSNDLFVAPSDEGLALYDGDMPLTGSITSMLKLWDAGTEVNEEPGAGPNQPPSQPAPNTGMDENGVVHEVNDGFTYPSLSELIDVRIEHDGGTLFTVTFENVSNTSSLPTPFAPGTWVVHFAGQKPMFADGATASPGLEALAEDGDVTLMDNNLSSKSGLMVVFAPGAYSVGEGNDVFTVGQSAGSALEALAEDGDVSGYGAVFNTPMGSSMPGPLTPGSSYSFTFTASQGDKLSLALMFVESNDWFAGLDEMALFNGDVAVSGDVTNKVGLYDAGTEVDEYAGAGNNQPLRQSGPNTGMDEQADVQLETAAGAHVPSIADMLEVTIQVN